MQPAAVASGAFDDVRLSVLQVQGQPLGPSQAGGDLDGCGPRRHRLRGVLLVEGVVLLLELQILQLEDLVLTGEGGDDLGLALLHEGLAVVGQIEGLLLASALAELPREHPGVLGLLGLRAVRFDLLDLDRFGIVERDPAAEGDGELVVEPPHLAPLRGQDVDPTADLAVQRRRRLEPGGQ